MNVNAVLECLKNREFWKSAVCLLGCIGLLWSTFTFCTVPRLEKVCSLRNDLVRLNIRSRQYDNFDKLRDRILLQRERIGNAMRSAAVDQLLTDRTQQGVFDAIGRLCERADIKLYTINPAETGGRQQDWRVNIKAPYHDMVAFISLLERSFKISKFKITSSRNAAVHSAELIVRPIEVPAPAGTSLPAEKNLFDLYLKIEVLLNGIEARSNTDRCNCPVLRDPLFCDENFPMVRENAAEANYYIRARTVSEGQSEAKNAPHRL